MQDVQLNGQAITSSTATTAPAAGTVETWTVTALGTGIPALAAGQSYALVDMTDGSSIAQRAEVIRVTAATGTGATSITVTRGADGTTPVAHANPAVFAIVAVGSHLVKPPVPPYAPVGLSGQWDNHRTLYRRAPSNWHSVRANCAKSAANARGLHIGVLGDSTMIGYDATTYAITKSIPYRLGLHLARLLGNPYPATGVTLPTAAYAVLGGRWTVVSGTWSTTNILAASVAGAASWTSYEQGTAIQFFYSNQTTIAFTYQIDGAAAVTVTPNNTQTIGVVTVTGLAYAFHTLQINAPGGGLTMIAGQRCYTPALNQIHMHNLAIGGAFANGGTHVEANWSSVSTSPGGLGWLAPQLLTQGSITLDLLLICIGGNDAANSISAANIAAGITSMRGYFPTVPAMLIHSIPVSGTSATLYDQVGAQYFALSDSLDVPHADWNWRVNQSASYIADGLAGTDNTHPTFPHQNDIAAWLAQCIAEETHVADQWANIIGGNGTFRLLESAGAYPLRPAAPAGAVTYSGTSVPTDMLTGDARDALP